MFADEGRASAGAGHRHTGGIERAHGLDDGRGAEQRAQPQRVATAEEEAAGALQVLNAAWRFAVAPGVEGERRDWRRTQVTEDAFVARPGAALLAGGGVTTMSAWPPPAPVANCTKRFRI